MSEICFYGFYTKLDEKIKKENPVSNFGNYWNSFYNSLKCLPFFPDVDLIVNLSYEKYERIPCKVNLIFLPFESESLYNKDKDDVLIFSYYNKTMTFSKENIRLIRKLSESSDDNHALVLCCDQDGNYNFQGVINKNEIDDAFSEYYYIKIMGYSHWSAKCKNFNICEYKNGSFGEYIEDDDVFKNQSNGIVDYFLSHSFEMNEDSLREILKKINDQKHGTSFVVFKDENTVKEETERLCSAQRGFKIENCLPHDKLVECLPQFTKVDGGLLLDRELNCYAYGCIYDGVVPKGFKGSLANGSRFNSTALYTYWQNNTLREDSKADSEDQTDNESELPICIGVVFSDDGGVKIAEVEV